MKLSMRWLSDHVTVDEPINKYMDAMTMSGTKVEGVEFEGGGMEGIVVGKVISTEKHPDADTLYICSVDIGKETPLQIVTGADNVTAGVLVPVATEGTRLPDGTEIGKGTLRGVDSFGMLCSLEELKLTHADFPYAKEDGIFLLEEDCVPGDAIADALGLNDTIVEFEITSNRPDCLAVLGIARETAATYGRAFSLPERTVKGGGTPIEDLLSLTVENETLCPRYIAAAIENVTIKPSPRWMRERLRASGVRPINNIVDITNFVMLEYGHPLHAFDLRHVSGEHIVVRSARAEEIIVTLEGTERKLTQDMLVISDENKATAIAGIMGGQYSGVYPDTHTVIFESACFNGPSVRRTSRALGMRTESSGRFEKGLDTQNCLPALERACELAELLGAGTVAEGFLDSAPKKPKHTEVNFDPDWINRYIGIDITPILMESYLENLGFVIENDRVLVPSWRGDVKYEVDLSEEIARMYGYDNIPTTQPRGVAKGTVTKEKQFRRRIANTLVAQGYSEIQTYSFIGPKDYDKICLAENSPLRDSITLQNPLGEDTSVMRTSAIPSLMNVLAYNYKNRNLVANLFEIATEYHKVIGELLPKETKHIMLGQYGEGADFYTLKGGVEALLEQLGSPRGEYRAVTDDPTFHPGRYAALYLDGQLAGHLGEVHPQVAENYGMDERVYLAHLDYQVLIAVSDAEPRYTPLPRYPASTRDLALVCDESLPVGTLEAVLRESIGETLESLKLFDVYRGAQLGEGKKSVAYALTLRAPDRTLTDKESDTVIAAALTALEEIGVSLRV